MDVIDCLNIRKDIEDTHILRNWELNLSYFDHKKPIDKYCEECKKTICITSVEIHDTHHHINPSNTEISLDSFSKDIDQIQFIIDANFKYKTEISVYWFCNQNTTKKKRWRNLIVSISKWIEN